MRDVAWWVAEAVLLLNNRRPIMRIARGTCMPAPAWHHAVDEREAGVLHISLLYIAYVAVFEAWAYIEARTFESPHLPSFRLQAYTGCRRSVERDRL